MSFDHRFNDTGPWPLSDRAISALNRRLLLGLAAGAGLTAAVGRVSLGGAAARMQGEPDVPPAGQPR
jgi:hypothetical protein